MTVVMLDARYAGSPSGIGRYAIEVTRAMQQRDAALRWRLLVRRNADANVLERFDTLSFDAEPYGIATSLWLGRRLGPRPADLFHSPFHVLPRGLRCATVVTMHDTFNFTHPETSNSRFPIDWLEWGYFLLAIPESLRRADRIVAVSRATADALISRMPELADKLRVIHHGVSPQFVRLADRERVARTCDRLVGAPFFLSVGALSPNKNHRRMLEAFARVCREPGAPKLVRVSRFGKDPSLERRAVELGVADRVVSLRVPSDAELVDLLNGALGLLFCSTAEGFGLPIVEAMACGCPVLTSNLSCLPEIAGGAALLADPRDVSDIAAQLRRLFDPTERDELRGRGLERARYFSWGRAAELHGEVYAEALALSSR